MNIKIKESGERKSLCITDDTGINWVQDLIGNTGALGDGQFAWSDEDDAYLTDQVTFDWWEKYIADCKATDAEIERLAEELEIDANLIWRRIQAACGEDYDRHRAISLTVMAEITAEYN